MSLKVSGLSLKVSSLSLKVSGLSLKVSSLSLKVSSSSLKVSSLSLKVSSLSLKVSSLSLKVSSSSLKVSDLSLKVLMTCASLIRFSWRGMSGLSPFFVHVEGLSTLHIQQLLRPSIGGRMPSVNDANQGRVGGVQTRSSIASVLMCSWDIHASTQVCVVSVCVRLF